MVKSFKISKNNQVQPLRSKKKKTKSERKVGASEEEIPGPTVAPVDDDLDIFAGLELSEAPSKNGNQTGPLFSESIVETIPKQEDIEAIRARLANAARVREQGRIISEGSVRKRSLGIAGDDFMVDTGPFGEKLDKESFGKYDEDAANHKSFKPRKKGEGKRT